MRNDPRRLAVLLVLLTGALSARGEGATGSEVARAMVEIRSQTGLCSVVLNDRQRLDLPLPTPEGPARGNFFALAPGRHRIVVKSFFTWHDRFVDVGPGELLEIQVEPRSFAVTTRKDGC